MRDNDGYDDEGFDDDDYEQEIGGTEYEQVLEQAHFDRFAALSGDHNPIHVDPDYAAGTRFGATVSHGMLLFTAVRGLIAHNYPGAELESQDLMFPNPAFAGEPLTVHLDIVAPPANDRLELITRVENESRQVCLEGRCRLKLNRKANQEARP
ncbi:MaoC/PaaZ C-terminal domain-containing protein [Alloalcanivorax sp. C16-1]|uniref:MaoC/PaaZ C-terminal domain-containing protein n=1 Tax=Alloalcanivorax sp. C16-1 TaxID=3390051 RepID=UPI0039706C7A